MAWTRPEVLVLLLLLILGAGVRFARLAEPNSFVFDETYYAKDACLYGGFDQEFCKSPHSTEQSYVHPPLGKWIIATGIRLFGYDSFGWRSAVATFGTLLVLLVYLLARRLFRDRFVAGAAGFLAATDFLLIVQSRVAMLDIFLAFFVLLGFLFLTLDRDRLMLQREQARSGGPGTWPGREPEYRVLAGVALGMAMAVKWSAAWALLAAAVLAASWSLGLARLHRKGSETWILGSERVLLREGGINLLALVLVPLLVYLLSYLHFFVANDFSVTEFVKLQRRMFEFHSTLEAEHAYQSSAFSWPLILRPVAYFFEADPKPSHILAFGNPAVWWASIGAAVWLAVRSRKRRSPERLIMVALLVQYGAWVATTEPLFSPRLGMVVALAYFAAVLPPVLRGFARNLRGVRRWPPRLVITYLAYLLAVLVAVPLVLVQVTPELPETRPAVFFFYMTPIVPFMVIGLAALLGAVRDLGAGAASADLRRAARLIPVVYLAAVGILLAYFYPVMTAIGLPRENWMNRMWFGGWI